MNSYLQNLIGQLARIYVNTPFYPHWLEHRESLRLRGKIFKDLASRLNSDSSLSLLEIGCGSQYNKISQFLPISYYCGLEYPQWWALLPSTTTKKWWANNCSSEKNPESSFLQRVLKEIIFATADVKTDVWGDGIQLPFRDNCFDIVAHFEVMEHVSSPELLFQEITRCLKPEGYVLFSVPFLYQNHSAIDISRLTKQGIEALCQKHELKQITYLCTGGGTAISQLANSFIIKNVVKIYADSSSLFRKVIIAGLATVLLFPVINVICFITDKIWLDDAYANRHYFLLKKL